MKKTILPLLLLSACCIAIASPVRSMLAADGTSSETAEEPSAASYIQNGLVVQWDAIENVGFGLHDSTSSVWVDLCGNAPDVPINASIFTWTEDSIDFSKNYYAPRVITISDDLYETLFSAMKRADLTVEFVLADRGSTVISPGQNGIATVALLWQAYGDRLFYFSGGNSIALNPFGSGYGYYRSIVPAIMEDRNYYSFTLNGIKDAYHIDTSVYCNNEVIPLVLPTNNTNFYVWEDRVDALYQDKVIILFANRNAISMSVNAIRIYARGLSPAEVAHNYRIDRLRFNLP